MATSANSSVLLYSPRQIYTSAMIGGPASGAWLLSRNFLALSDAKAARWSLAVGCLAVVALLPLLLVLPAKFPNLVIPLAYSTPFYYYAKSKFADNAERSVAYVKGGVGWLKIIGVALLWLAVTFGFWMGGALLAETMFPGIFHLPD